MDYYEAELTALKKKLGGLFETKDLDPLEHFEEIIC